MIAVAAREARAQGRGRGPRREERLTERFHLGVDGVITVLTSKVEVGQGSRTQITQAAAEELVMPVDRIRLIMADTAQCPDDGGTAGSRTTPSTVPRVRAAAAALRQLLKEHTAEHFGVAAEQVEIADGVYRTSSQQSLTIGEFAKSESLLRRLTEATAADETAITAVEDWQVLGTSVAKVQGRDIVTGSAIYASDVRRPGMLYGKVVRPPAYGATLRSIDLDGVDADDGVIVRDGDFIGCAAKTSWQASELRDALARRCQWNKTAQTSSEELFDHFKQTARNPDRGGSDLSAALAGAAHKIQNRYTIAYVQHAPMEPRAAVAEWDDGKLTVWTGTQQPLASTWRALQRLSPASGFRSI